MDEREIVSLMIQGKVDGEKYMHTSTIDCCCFVCWGFVATSHEGPLPIFGFVILVYGFCRFNEEL